jgi:hypothetical protein
MFKMFRRPRPFALLAIEADKKVAVKVAVHAITYNVEIINAMYHNATVTSATETRETTNHEHDAPVTHPPDPRAPSHECQQNRRTCDELHAPWVVDR